MSHIAKKRVLFLGSIPAAIVAGLLGFIQESNANGNCDCRIFECEEALPPEVCNRESLLFEGQCIDDEASKCAEAQPL